MRIAIALGRGPGTEATKANARRAARLYLDGRVDYIVMSGRCSFTDEDPGDDATECAEMTIVALEMGVPNDKLIPDNWARDTVSNMVGSLRALRRRGIVTTKLVLVVLPYTEDRALYAAGKVYNRLRGKITAVASDYLFPGPGEAQQIQREERRHYWTTRLLLAFIRPGNIRAIQRRLQLVHPGYRTWRSHANQPINLMA